MVYTADKVRIYLKQQLSKKAKKKKKKEKKRKHRKHCQASISLSSLFSSRDKWQQLQE